MLGALFDWDKWLRHAFTSIEIHEKKFKNLQKIRKWYEFPKYDHFLRIKISRNYISKMSLNRFLSPRLIIKCAKFRKEWISDFKNSPKVKFMATSFNTAKDAGCYKVAISRTWRGIPNKLPEMFPGRILQVLIAKYTFNSWHQLLVTHLKYYFTAWTRRAL